MINECNTVLHELHESKYLFVSRIEFIRSKLSNFSAHVSGVADGVRTMWKPQNQSTGRSRSAHHYPEWIQDREQDVLDV